MFHVNRLLDVNGIVILDGLNYPSIQRVVSFIATLGRYWPLAIPELIQGERKFRVRKMMGLAEFRSVGFQTTSVDNRWLDWYKHFSSALDGACLFRNKRNCE